MLSKYLNVERNHAAEVDAAKLTPTEIFIKFMVSVWKLSKVQTDHVEGVKIIGLETFDLSLPSETELD